MFIADQGAIIVSVTQHPSFVVEFAGRICYKSESGMTGQSCSCLGVEQDLCDSCKQRRTAFIKKLIRNGHSSVIEHASMTVLFITDRGISHEIVRHRLASYSQESTRYCNYGKKSGEITVVKPNLGQTFDEKTESDATSDWVLAMQKSENTYLKLIERGASPQHARSVLPTCLKTEIVMTANMREWRHFFELRLLGKHGTPHPQIRELCAQLIQQIKENEENLGLVSIFFSDIFDKYNKIQRTAFF